MSGSEPGSHAHREPEQDLERLLAAALAADLARPVDTRDLLDGARTRAHRIRRRRAVATAALGVVLFAGVPLGVLRLGGLDRLTGAGGSPAAGRTTSASATASVAGPTAAGGTTGTSASTRQATTATDATGTVPGTTVPGSQESVPTGVEQSSAQGYRLEYRGAVVLVPQTAVLLPGDLRSTVLQQVQDLPALTAGPADAATICPWEPSGRAHTVAARQLRYAQQPAAVDQWVVTTTVRVMTGDGAGQRLAWLDGNLSRCQPGYQLVRVPTGIADGDSVLGYRRVAQPPDAGSLVLVGAVRQGKTTAEVQLQVPAAAAHTDATRLAVALDQARRLLVLAQQRLQTSGLAAAAEAELS